MTETTQAAGTAARTDEARETGVSRQDGAPGRGCGCGCGGHGQAPEGTGAPDAPGQEAPAQPGSPAAIAQAVVSVLGQADGSAGTPTTGTGEATGVLPGRRAGNQLGLRDVSAAPSGGCGCGGH